MKINKCLYKTLRRLESLGIGEDNTKKLMSGYRSLDLRINGYRNALDSGIDMAMKNNFKGNNAYKEIIGYMGNYNPFLVEKLDRDLYLELVSDTAF